MEVGESECLYHSVWERIPVLFNEAVDFVRHLNDTRVWWWWQYRGDRAMCVTVM